MSKGIMGNGGFYGSLSELQGVSAWWKETAQTRIRFSSFLVAESSWNSVKLSQTVTTHNANRHCRVRFYTFVGQPLSKQLYVVYRYSCSSAISTLEGIENKQRLQTLSIDNAWSNKNFLFYLTFRMLQHTSSEVNGYNCYKHFKKYKNKEGNWWQDKNNDKIDTTDSWYYQ